jgi:hypothetical protein
MCMKGRPRQTQGKKARYDAEKELKAIARERVGVVKPGRVIVPKTARKKPKHKKPPGAEE